MQFCSWEASLPGAQASGAGTDGGTREEEKEGLEEKRCPQEIREEREREKESEREREREMLLGSNSARGKPCLGRETAYEEAPG